MAGGAVGVCDGNSRGGNGRGGGTGWRAAGVRDGNVDVLVVFHTVCDVQRRKMAGGARWEYVMVM
jgi:hypothetical protein